jgi:hypothetical protein
MPTSTYRETKPFSESMFTVEPLCDAPKPWLCSESKHYALAISFQRNSVVKLDAIAPSKYRNRNTQKRRPFDTRLCRSFKGKLISV